MSFAAYPLVYKQDAVAVLAIFSKKKFSTIDFEILGVFCDQLSKDLTGFFDAKEFLSNWLINHSFLIFEFNFVIQPQ